MAILYVIGDVTSALSLLGWWLGAYETHVGTLVATMAGVYYLFQFHRWLRKD